MIFRFLHIWFLFGLLLVPLLVYIYWLIEKKGRPRLKFPDLGPLKEIRPSPLIPFRHLPVVLRTLALSLLIIGLARPQSGTMEEEVLSEGVDIIIALDTSTSMSLEDFEPKNRLTVAKEVTRSFIRGRPYDRIGLIVFSALAFTKCPLTLDHGILLNFLDRVGFTRKEHDGTAIGTALATAVNRVRNSTAKSKIVVLVTDGENNRGMDPVQAANLAEAMGVKVYPVGVVNPGRFLNPVDDLIFGRRYVVSMPSVDEGMMKRIAKTTGGKYFRATDPESLSQVFKEIDRMEKTKIKARRFYRYSERFAPWVLAGLLFLVVELILSHTRFRRLP